MTNKEKKAVLEAVLFTMGEAIEVDRLASVIEEDAEKTVDAAVELPDIITIPDRINLEKLILVVGTDIENFERKVLLLNEKLRSPCSL